MDLSALSRLDLDNNEKYLCQICRVVLGTSPYRIAKFNRQLNDGTENSFETRLIENSNGSTSYQCIYRFEDPVILSLTKDEYEACAGEVVQTCLDEMDRPTSSASSCPCWPDGLDPVEGPWGFISCNYKSGLGGATAESYRYLTRVSPSTDEPARSALLDNTGDTGFLQCLFVDYDGTRVSDNILTPEEYNFCREGMIQRCEEYAAVEFP